MIPHYLHRINLNPTDTMLSVASGYASEVNQFQERDMNRETKIRQNAINWFEIPCENLDRAVTFYETLLDAKMRRGSPGDPIAVFPADQAGTGGTLVKRAFRKRVRTGLWCTSTATATSTVSLPVSLKRVASF